MKNSIEEQKKEKYFFLRLYAMDFWEAQKSIEILKDVKKLDVRYRLLRDIAVTYARPFSINRGRLIRKDQCPKSIVPKEYVKLHDDLFKLRNERFAHSDLDHYNPGISRWKTIKGWMYPMSFRGIDYAWLDKQLIDIERLVSKVRISLQLIIEKYEASFNQSDAG